MLGPVDLVLLTMFPLLPTLHESTYSVKRDLARLLGSKRRRPTNRTGPYTGVSTLQIGASESIRYPASHVNICAQN